MVFAAVRTYFPRKAPTCLVDRTAIHKQQFKYDNEHTFMRSVGLVDWLKFFPGIRAAGAQTREGGKLFFFFSFFFFSFLSLFWELL